MVDTKDWLLRYGIILGKRYSVKERTKFLQSAQREFAAMGYAVDTTASEVKLFKNEKRTFYNLYAGNVKDADIVYATYYDTPVKSYGLYQPNAFQMKNNSNVLRVNLLILLMAMILFGGILYFALFPQIQANGWISFWTVLTALLAFLFYSVISYLRGGIPNRVNMIRNTSSILTLLKLANTLPKQKRKKAAFAFVDGGTYSDYGVQMLRSYLKNPKTKIVLLDGVGNHGTLQWFTDKKITVDAGEIHALPDSLQRLGDILLTSGEYDGVSVNLSPADTKKDSELDEKQITTAINELAQLIA